MGVGICASARADGCRAAMQALQGGPTVGALIIRIEF